MGLRVRAPGRESHRSDITASPSHWFIAEIRPINSGVSLLSLAVLRCYGHTLSETYEGFRREGGSTGCFSANISGISEDVVIASCDLTKCWKTLQSSSELPVTVIPV